MKPLTPAAKRKIGIARETITELEAETLSIQAQIETLQGKLDQNRYEISRAKCHIWEATHPGKRRITHHRDTFEPDLAFTIVHEDEPDAPLEICTPEAITA